MIRSLGDNLGLEFWDFFVVGIEGWNSNQWLGWGRNVVADEFSGENLLENLCHKKVCFPAFLSYTHQAVRTDKNLYSKNLVESLEEINEMRKKFKVTGPGKNGGCQPTPLLMTYPLRNSRPCLIKGVWKPCYFLRGVYTLKGRLTRHDGCGAFVTMRGSWEFQAWWMNKRCFGSNKQMDEKKHHVELCLLRS